ncbi:nucleoside-diphosphate-sugar epimerase GsfE [Aspergillus steynii IBT 23096]|uniref:Nucleoside-diphosphate-sugar epimerase GsfE n=1 Tax=Aspergillus steynii IBT 23096 TaxID=1392250 RepID=A0A2I2G6M0_9EURO|nr:nucleoside-diphosphate-sugar epimerase GsfE [Aspergillus steynii IBT 23096]PLB48513.1 nucleoside-diphosphate-sugar epimerase GsfE [Aspergillus steynii IBT 23096]
MSPTVPGIAFVTGANGISGLAIVEHLIRQPSSEWSKIVITSRSPLKNYYVDPRVRFIALDFMQPAETIQDQIKDVCKDVTHAFFTSYIHDNDFDKLPEKNGPLFRNFLESVDVACPELERVVLQTGGKHYGFQFREIHSPTVENLPRYEGPEPIFYYEQEDDLFAIQNRRNAWQYNIIRPVGILGFTPQFGGINEAIPIAQYFLVCRELGTTPRWPGTLESYNRVEDMSYAPSIASLTVWAATQDHCGNEAFNHINGSVIVWRFLWNMFSQYFGVALDSQETPTEETAPMDMAEWASDKGPVWEHIVAKYGGKVESFRLDSFALMNWYITPSQQKMPFMSTVSKARKMGWSRVDNTYESWIATFRSYENAGVLPVQRDFTVEW